jgi:hypothetical protein
MTPERVQETLTEDADEPLSDTDCTPDSDAAERFRQLRAMIFQAHVNKRAWASLTDEQRQQIEDDRAAVETARRTVRTGIAQSIDGTPAPPPVTKRRPPDITFATTFRSGYAHRETGHSADLE